MTAPPAMILGHFLVHTNDDPAILADSKLRLEARGVPFAPGWGKLTSGLLDDVASPCRLWPSH